MEEKFYEHEVCVYGQGLPTYHHGMQTMRSFIGKREMPLLRATTGSDVGRNIYEDGLEIILIDLKHELWKWKGYQNFSTANISVS